MKLTTTNAKRTAALLLSLCMTIPLAACAGDGGGNAAETTTAAADVTTEVTTTEDPYVPDIPDDADFGGEELMVLMPAWSLYREYYFTEDETGETVNDTILERSRKVEEQINIDINFRCDEYIDLCRDRLFNAVLAGDDIYDLYFTHNSTSILAYTSEHYVHNWYDIPHIDMDMPYWSQSARDCLEIDGVLTLTASNLIIPDINSLFYNKSMHKNYDIAPLEAIIDDGAWTWDELIEMAAVVTTDLNGDGTMDDQDQYGYLGEHGWQIASITTSNDQFIISKNDAGVHELSIDTEKMVTIVEKMHSFFNESGNSFTWAYSKEVDPNAGGTPPVSFDSGRGLFYMVPLSLANYFRTTDVDFGIIPLPKFDEAQENYRSLNWAGFMAVPITATNLEMIGMATELLSYYNDKLVMPVFYDVLLGQKIARDEESIHMLDLIFDNAVYDLGINLNMYNILYLSVNANGAFASTLESNRTTYEKSVSDYIEAFENYNG